jgi:hypothetical protein
MSNQSIATPGQRRVFGLFGVIFGSLFVVVGLFVMSIGIRNGYRQMATEHWRAVDGTLVSKSLEGRTKTNKSQSPVTYKYTVDQLEYFSDRVLYADLQNLDYGEWASLANGLPQSGTVTVYVNPSNPQESVLRKGAQPLSWQGVGIGALVTGFILAWMATWWGMTNVLPNLLEKRRAAQQAEKPGE